MIKHSLQFLFILLFAFCIAACSTDKVELEDTIENGGQTQPGETNEEEHQEYPAEQVQYCSLDTIKYRIQPTQENFEAAYKKKYYLISVRAKRRSIACAAAKTAMCPVHMHMSTNTVSAPTATPIT